MYCFDRGTVRAQCRHSGGAPPTVQPMSTDTQRADPEAAFQRYVEDAPATCESCFRRVADVDTDGVNVETRGVHGEVVTVDDDGRVTGTEPRDEHAARYDWQPWDACPFCGRLGLSSPDATLSVERAQTRAVRLSRRLSEFGIGHDWRLLVWFVGQAKRNEDLAGKDRDIAARAVEFAIRQSRTD